MTSSKCMVLVLASLVANSVSINSSLSQTMEAPKAPSQAVTEPAGPLHDIRTLSDFEQWATFYYVHPRPDLTIKALKFADKNGVFEIQGSTAVLIALMREVFAENPKQLASWIEQLSSMTPQHKAFVWNALSWVNTPQSKALANQLAQQFPTNQRPPVLSESSPSPEPIERMELSPDVLDMLWTSFFVSGDEKYIERIMSALPGSRQGHSDPGKLITAGAAQWSLASNAYQHKRVMEICLNARRKHPELLPQLDKIIAQAKSRSGK